VVRSRAAPLHGPLSRPLQKFVGSVAEKMGHVDLLGPPPGTLLAYGDPARFSRGFEELVEEVVEEAPAPEGRASSSRLRRMDIAEVLDPLSPSGDNASDRDGRRPYAAHVAESTSHLLTSFW
jgi:hypothetical protein